MRTQNLTRTAVMVAVLVVLGFIPGIPLGIIPVPIVLQNMGIMVAGLLLGPRNGTIAVSLFLFLAFVGLPILSGGRGGAATFVGPTGGYMLGWLFVPALMGLMMQRVGATGWLAQWLILVVIGVLFVDIVGAVWLTFQSGMTIWSALLSNVVFIPGDLIKAGVTVVLVRRLERTGLRVRRL